jgi:D-alanyl-D-alanine dipeptidase
MGTPFDNFTTKANHNYNQLPEQVKKNRLLLKTVMEKYGFRSLSTEWWHYSWPNDNNYQLLDLSQTELITSSS